MRFSNSDNVNNLISSELKDNIPKVLEVANTFNIPYDNLYLFGSCSRAEANSKSDIDIAIIRDLSFRESSDVMGELCNFVILPIPINISILSEVGFAENKLPIYNYLRKDGIKLCTLLKDLEL